jgi:hypothetical protein
MARKIAVWWPQPMLAVTRPIDSALRNRVMLPLRRYPPAKSEPILDLGYRDSCVPFARLECGIAKALTTRYLADTAAVER